MSQNLLNESSKTLRPELEPLPAQMADLPVDERGYVIPWFVDWIDGKPEFRAMDQQKWIRAIKERLCWVCGGKLGVHLAFLAGPMCGINRTTSEPPCHQACARWSARNCPFLNNPQMVRREDDLMNNVNAGERAAGFAITRNPGVVMVWNTRTWERFNTPKGPLITMGEPDAVEFYHRGRPATREEVRHSVDTGLPILQAMASAEEGGLPFLLRAIDRFEKWIPA